MKLSTSVPLITTFATAFDSELGAVADVADASVAELSGLLKTIETLAAIEVGLARHTLAKWPFFDIYGTLLLVPDILSVGALKTHKK